MDIGESHEYRSMAEVADELRTNGYVAHAGNYGTD